MFFVGNESDGRIIDCMSILFFAVVAVLFRVSCDPVDMRCNLVQVPYARGWSIRTGTNGQLGMTSISSPPLYLVTRIDNILEDD